MKIVLRDEWKGQYCAEAARRLAQSCALHVGHSTRPIMEFLCGLWNPYEYRPDLQRLCERIDEQDYEDVIAVMTLIRHSGHKIENLFVDGDAIMQEFSRHICSITQEKI